VLQILLFAVIIHFQTGPFKGYQILKSMKKFVQTPWLLALLLVGTAIISCKKDKLETIAGFSYQVDAADYKKERSPMPPKITILFPGILGMAILLPRLALCTFIPPRALTP